MPISGRRKRTIAAVADDPRTNVLVSRVCDAWPQPTLTRSPACRVTRHPAKGGHVLLLEVLSSVRQALALYGKMSGFSQSLTCPHCWLQWHNIISIVYTDLIVKSVRGILLTKYNLKKLSCVEFHAYVSANNELLRKVSHLLKNMKHHRLAAL